MSVRTAEPAGRANPRISRGLPATLVVLWLLIPSSAQAFVISEDPLDDSSFEIGGAVWNQNLWLRGGPLESPFSTPSANPAALSLATLRPKLELKLPELSLVVHDELIAISNTLDSDALGGTLAIGQGARPPVWLPLEWSSDSSRVQVEDRVDWLYARVTAGDFGMTLGRQPLSLGRGQLWTPEDLLAPFSPLALNTEYKPGIDAARLDWTIAEGATLMLVGSLGKLPPKPDFAVGRDGSAVLSHLEVAVARLRLGALAGWVRGDEVAGIDLFVDLGHGSDLHGAGTLSYVPDAARRPWHKKAFNRAVLGTTSKLTKKLLLSAELYYNGSGAPRASAYPEEFYSPRFAVGEEYNVGRLYAGVAASWQAHPLLSVLLSTIANLEDTSLMLAPQVDYSVTQNAALLLGALLPAGKKPRYDAQGLTARSEFGMYPEVYHADVKLYF